MPSSREPRTKVRSATQRMGIKKNFPSHVHLVVTQLRCIAVGELAGEWEDFGGIRPQLANLASVALVASANNQEAAAKLHEARNAERRQLAWERRGLSKVKHQLMRTLAE